MSGLLYLCMTCSLDVCKINLLDYAPCPPPMLSYGTFREHALNQSLLLTELCSIARRCILLESDLAVDCPEEEITTEKSKPTSATNIARVVVFSLVACIVALGIFLLYKKLHQTGRNRTKKNKGHEKKEDKPVPLLELDPYKQEDESKSRSPFLSEH